MICYYHRQGGLTCCLGAPGTKVLLGFYSLSRLVRGGVAKWPSDAAFNPLGSEFRSALGSGLGTECLLGSEFAFLCILGRFVEVLAPISYALCEHCWSASQCVRAALYLAGRNHVCGTMGHIP